MQTESKNHHVYNIFKKMNTGEMMGLYSLCSMMSMSTLNLPLLANLLCTRSNIEEQANRWESGSVIYPQNSA